MTVVRSTGAAQHRRTYIRLILFFFFFQAEDGIRDLTVTGVQTCALPISSDKVAAYPTSHPHDPRDMAATIYHLLGVRADTTIYDQTARPHRLVIGKKIEDRKSGV